MNFIDIVNNTDSNIRFRLVYTVDGKLVSDITPDFKPTKIKRIDLPINAIVIILTVWIILPNGETLEIYTESISKSIRKCYIVNKSNQSYTCKEINCSSLPDTDFIDILNKTHSIIRFEIIYTIKGIGYKESSRNIKPSRSSAIIVPRASENVQLKVLLLEEKPHEDIWHTIYAEYVKHPFKYCYKASGDFPDVSCTKISCNSGNNISIPCPCLCHCCHCCSFNSSNCHNNNFDFTK